MLELVSAVEPKLIATMKDWSRVNVTVLDNNTLFLGAGQQGKQELLTASIGGFVGGHKVDKTHPFADWFIGELWGIGSVENMAINIMIAAPVKGGSRFGG